MYWSHMREGIQVERVKEFDEKDPVKGDYVLYWMQRAQRTEYNHALEFSIARANELDVPLVVYFGLTDDFPEADERHYRFMLEGLNEVDSSLEDRDINFVVKKKKPPKGAEELGDDACMVILDRAYLDLLRDWRRELSRKVDCPVVQVESDVVVPVEEVSEKEEYAARTIRPKIDDKLDRFLTPLKKGSPKSPSLDLDFDGVELNNVDEVLKGLDLKNDVPPVDSFRGGTSRAESLLDSFLKDKMQKYPDLSNDPSKNVVSHMSPYLHFGQISPLYIALKVKEEGGKGVDEYLEELIVRRELSMNFVYHSEDYDSMKCLPDWAQETLEEHEDDEREYVYSREEFEKAKIHDPYWNAAQDEMVKTGKMHGYMRMYWGKKILEWSETPEEAYETALHLNNKYELDGRDPNGYAGVAWCFGKHDQGWKERDVYGKVRYMNANGLERKFDIQEYVERVKDL